ncbi:MAG: SUMF1/EgtB/PvdO family nonheme iron enzyme [Myxococcales bacterium]|nr:SUMF1/EgtB/PvdO family nonheme iron enzyme [Myxococcales bacterium]
MSVLVLLVATSGCPADEPAADDEGTDSETGTDSTDTGDSDTGELPDPNLAEVPGGTFEMGCTVADGTCDADAPVHSVTLSGFAMELTEVTVEAYQACVDAGGCTAAGEGGDCNTGSAGRDQHPVNCVTWQQAADYCGWKGRRLPTEAEWEYAARGDDGRVFPWGDTAASCAYAHMFETVMEMGDYGCMSGATAPVGSYPSGASPFGMLDMAGNVEEWVADWYDASYYNAGPASDPPGPAGGTQRVQRGGDLLDASANNLRSFERWRSAPDAATGERGFRCAADL